MAEPRDWHSRGYLPHFDDGKSIQTISYRLADSLPAQVLEQLEEQTLDDEKRRAAIEHYLDAGHGSCILRDDKNAQAVFDTWHHSHGIAYHLHAWVVMPNHVHVLIEPVPGRTIGEIVGAWKSVSARKILNAALPGTATAPGRSSEVAAGGGRGPRKKRHFWQHDYYDRFIRNERHYAAAVDYIHQNPVKAGLARRAEDWPWSSVGARTAGNWDRGRSRPL